MMNNEECFYDGVSYLDEGYFTTDENIAIFNALRNKQEIQSSSLLEKTIDDVRIRAAIRVIDATWTTRSDFRQAMTELKNTYNKRQLYHAINNVVSKFDTIEPTKAAEDIYTSVMDLELESSNTDILDPKELAVDYL